MEALQREGFSIITEIAMDTDTSPGSQNAGSSNQFLEGLRHKTPGSSNQFLEGSRVQPG